ncbi:T9SS type A sorting domain-containing protein [Arcticibacterium luteifluviistationis]|uniref:Secretion system C-terminal sorting domain-containing protein n=1 Tax=Arcticibacterium luteifluviistationis TaxID=1784714 RepID=A0A2Z4GC31_9BACT|nr:T9SS type A sorting domain-containing protein [Arcticibacterium luteifluviistationis]AWV98859.1 hypothetical protein DJ013_12030 [Arcticibacterium luteifluviistationis]
MNLGNQNILSSVVTTIKLGFIGCLLILSIIPTFSQQDANTIKINSCKVPTYSVGGKDVSNSTVNDGKITISGVENATHYEILESTTPFDFSLASELVEGQTKVEIKGLKNPSLDLVYKIRLYNKTEQCFTDQSVHLSHLNFAEKLDYTQVEVIQGVDNPSPQIGDIITFTTIVQNNGGQSASNLELKQFFSESLELVYFFADIGEFTPIGNVWQIGSLSPGQQPKLVIRARVKEQGLSYLTSYVSKANGYIIFYGGQLPTQDNTHAIAATSCVSVPIEIKKDEVYRVSLDSYANLTWYYKDAAGNFSEINETTNSTIAEINVDSSLSIKQGGEYTYTKQIGECTFNSCCPILVQSCKGPTIIVDSVYCNTTVDSYSMVVHLMNDNWSVVEKVYYALSNLSFPVLTNFLRRLNILPLTSSSGYVTSLGGGYYRIDNVPAFMPNVTLVSTDMGGECRSFKIVNAPDCNGQLMQMPELANTVEYYSPARVMPSLKVENGDRKVKTYWYSDELGINQVSKGNSFRPDDVGKYFVAFYDKKTKNRSALVEAEIKSLVDEIPGEFVNVSVCDCESSSMIPTGTKEAITVAKIYPNPVKDDLNVEYVIPKTAKNADMFVFSIQGKQLGSYALDLSKETKQINVSAWPDGLYILTVAVDGEKKLTHRFVVRH